MGNHQHVSVGKLFAISITVSTVILSLSNAWRRKHWPLHFIGISITSQLRLCPASLTLARRLTPGFLLRHLRNLPLGHCPHYSDYLLIRDPQESWRGQWRSISKGHHMDLNWPLGHRAKRSQLERPCMWSDPAWTCFFCNAWTDKLWYSLLGSDSRCRWEGCAALHQTEGWYSAEATYMQILKYLPLTSSLSLQTPH